VQPAARLILGQVIEVRILGGELRKDTMPSKKDILRQIATTLFPDSEIEVRISPVTWVGVKNRSTSGKLVFRGEPTIGHIETEAVVALGLLKEQMVNRDSYIEIDDAGTVVAEAGADD
jgi:hypothetical protein